MPSDIRKAILPIIATAFGIVAASAASLPINASYCDEGETSIGPDGFAVVEDFWAVDDASEPPRFHFVLRRAAGVDVAERVASAEISDKQVEDAAFYATVVENTEKKTLTITFEQNADGTIGTETKVFHLCPFP